MVASTWWTRAFAGMMIACLPGAASIGAQSTESDTTVSTGGGEGGLCTPVPGAPRLNGIAYSVRSDADDQLYRFDPATGLAVAVGPVGFADVECLAFSESGELFGVDDVTDTLITIDIATGAGTAVGPLGVTFTDCGLSFDDSGGLFMSVDSPSPLNLYSVDPVTGAAVAIGPQGQRVTGLTYAGGTLYGLGGDGTNNLLDVDRATGAATEIGAFTGVSPDDGGIDFDGNGVLWGIEDGGCVFVLDAATGAATPAATTFSGFESLAILRPQLIQAVPGLSQRGIAALAALLAAAAFLMLRRR